MKAAGRTRTCITAFKTRKSGIVGGLLDLQRLLARLGIEPRSPGYEPGVLPLNYRAFGRAGLEPAHKAIVSPASALGLPTTLAPYRVGATIGPICFVPLGQGGCPSLEGSCPAILHFAATDKVYHKIDEKQTPVYRWLF